MSRNSIDVAGGFLAICRRHEQEIVLVGGRECPSELGDRLSALRLMSEPSQQVIEASLVRYGQLSPVICSREATSLVVVDGFKRLRAAVRLGWSELQVMVHESRASGASQLLLWQSNQSNDLTDLEQAWLVRSLYREEKLTQPQIAHLVRSPSTPRVADQNKRCALVLGHPTPSHV